MFQRKIVKVKGRGKRLIDRLEFGSLFGGGIDWVFAKGGERCKRGK